MHVVDAVDADVDARLRFSLSGGGSGGKSRHNLFAVDAQSGAIRVAANRLLPAADDADGFGSVTVTVVDQDARADSVALHFYAADPAQFPVFVYPSHTHRLRVNVNSGVGIGSRLIREWV